MASNPEQVYHYLLKPSRYQNRLLSSLCSSEDHFGLKLCHLVRRICEQHSATSNESAAWQSNK